MRILVAEDDKVIRDIIVSGLRRSRYAVDHTDTVGGTMQKIQDEEYDLLILDRMLPDGDSLSALPELRSERPGLPVLFLTAKSSTEDIISGLDAGAEEYIPKPFSLAELTARVRVLLRRSRREPISPVITIGPLTIDTNACVVKRNGTEIVLSPREYALLEYLARNSGKTVDRLTLLTHVWDDRTDMFSNTVDVHIRYLRKKIDEGYQPALIRTVKGKGYMLCA